MKPLQGVRVLDMSRVLAGPWAGQVLADLGADVIKVERPGSGDDTRGWGPPFLRDTDGRETDEAAYYLAANRGKRSLALDIATPEGRDIIRRLAADSDVLIENFKAGGLKRHGLDYESLSALNPSIVYCSITGFGQSGPDAVRPGYDFVIQAMAGLMSVTGPDTGMDAVPHKVGIAMADLATGLYTVIAILAALNERGREGQAGRGRGRHIDMALFDASLGLMANQAMNYLIGDNVPGPSGNAHPNIVPYQVFATLDGQMVLAAGNDGQFRAFTRVAGRPGLADDARFATNRARVENRADLVPVLAGIMASRTTSDWVSSLKAAGVPAGPVNALDAAFAEPSAVARGLRFDLPHPLSGTVPQVAPPLRLDGELMHADMAPPLLGQHTDEILSELGIDGSLRQSWRARGLIA